MKNERIATLLVEIESLDKEIDSCVRQIKEYNDYLPPENIALEKLKNERQKLKSDIRSLGFFKFKERKPLKEGLSELNRKINGIETRINELKMEIDSLTKQGNDFKVKRGIIQKEKDRIQKEEELKELASQGNPKAQFDLAKLYFDKKNTNEAMNWLKKAADQEHDDAKKFLLQIEEDKKRILSASYDVTLW